MLESPGAITDWEHVPKKFLREPGVCAYIYNDVFLLRYVTQKKKQKQKKKGKKKHNCPRDMQQLRRKSQLAACAALFATKWREMKALRWSQLPSSRSDLRGRGHQSPGKPALKKESSLGHQTEISPYSFALLSLKGQWTPQCVTVTNGFYFTC